jgi:hypothetical protein
MKTIHISKTLYVRTTTTLQTVHYENFRIYNIIFLIHYQMHPPSPSSSASLLNSSTLPVSIFIQICVEIPTSSPHKLSDPATQIHSSVRHRFTASEERLLSGQRQIDGFYRPIYVFNIITCKLSMKTACGLSFQDS